ncbi:hypothetical protein PFICI_14606 [Pestalotiopsis fici W106-1]|uniref:Uncharacterized protein n=1 Tax=Pestalotiopsis fici (strain W106-1 / CGMCC3.15140) TaxID=1229662 RepID=W3WIA7_PESFW|nr:uncharacterized protein PFICI_14606 [Pestalotiopsis fici W106-1]ETS73660.1 hypothetical protein PFICI_14606 [Pestalotiopsis fici W106-1]
MDILKRTFTAYRISIVVEPPAPEVLSQRLRDHLAGDTVRGIEIRGAETIGGSDAGALMAVDWRVLSDPDRRQEDHSDADDNNHQYYYDDQGPTHRVELVYERNTFLAYLFIARGLLLINAPVPVRGALVRFLMQTLDTRATVLVPDSGALMRILETWLGDEDGSGAAGFTQKDVAITLRFADKASAGGLRTLDIAIPAQDLAAFTGTSDGDKFSDRLASYVDKHLALNMRHSDVRIAKISCGGFVLGEGKVKLMDEAKVAAVLDGIK